MFHCNGWCFPWSLVGRRRHARVPALGARQGDVRRHRRARRHALCGAPIVHVDAAQRDPAEERPIRQTVSVQPRGGAAAAGGAAPRWTAAGLRTDPPLRADRDLRTAVGERVEPRLGRSRRGRARGAEAPGRACATSARRPHRPRSARPWPQCPHDGETLGEVMFRGNIVMKGYLKNPRRPPRRLSRAAGSTPAISACCTRRLHSAQGPVEGHHHFGRRKHLLDRGGGRALQASVGRRRGGRRQAGREVGRDAVRLRRAASPGVTATAEELIACCRATARALQGARATSSSRDPEAPRPARSRSSSCAEMAKDA